MEPRQRELPFPKMEHGDARKYNPGPETIFPQRGVLNS